ncbi:MAG: hypothetical protein JW920_10755 [Deltaproteobacteria bacterium]|nr:hypothetical protein [Deltaproteobacteria bacterium]
MITIKNVVRTRNIYIRCVASKIYHAGGIYNQDTLLRSFSLPELLALKPV